MFKFKCCKKPKNKFQINQEAFLKLPIEERSKEIEKINIKLKNDLGASPPSSNQNGNVYYGNYYTCGSYPNHAIAIGNHVRSSIQYWYTNDGVTLWYKHTIGPVSSTWDWEWADFYTKYTIEFKIPLDETTARYVVVALDSFQGDAVTSIQKPISNIFVQDADINNPPAFNNGGWEVYKHYVQPGHVDWTAVYHSRIEFNQDLSISWGDDN